MSRKIYVASPFFTEFTRLVKNRMMERVKEVFEAELFDPASTDSSKEYGKTTTIEDRIKFGRQIFHENCEEIDSCDSLIFPKYTRDLGTLFELGYAWGRNKTILCYDYLSHNINTITYPDQNYIISTQDSYFNLSSVYQVVYFGYLYAKGKTDLEYYLPESMMDNVMFAANFKRVDEFGHEIQKDWSIAE